MGYAIGILAVIVLGILAYFKFKGSSLESEKKVLDKNDEQLAKKIEASKKIVEDHRKQVEEVKAQDLTPTEVEDFWSKK